MRKVIKLLLVIYVVAAGIYFSGENLMGKAAQRVAEESTQAIPANVHTRLVAVSDIKGDDGTLERAIINSLKNDSHFQVIERTELDTLLKEQALQISDLVSPDERVRPGMIRGVEGVIHGRVLENTNYLAYAAYRVQLKMTSVQTGEILLSEEISSSRVSPYLLPASVGFVVLLILSRAASFFSSATNRRNEKNRGKEESVRKQIVATMKASIDTLRAVEQGVDMDKDADTISGLRTTRSSLEIVYDKAIAVRYSDPGNESPKALTKHDAQVLKATTALLEAVQPMKSNGDVMYIAKALKKANASINNIELMLTTRQ